MKKASGQWLESAQMDLASIDRIIECEELTPVAAFHAQQCVEKCFKAVLEEYSTKVPREHSTLKLYGMVRELVQIEVDGEILTDLDDLYIGARYPGELGLLPYGKPTCADARRFYEFAKGVQEQVTRALARRLRDEGRGLE